MKGKVKTGTLIFVVILFLLFGIPNTMRSAQLLKEYRVATKQTDQLREQQMKVDRQKSQIINKYNTKPGSFMGGEDMVSVTNAIADIPNITITKIVAMNKSGTGQEEIRATLNQAKEVESLSETTDVLEYTIKTKAKHMSSTILKIEELNLDYDRMTLVVPNSSIVLRILFDGGDS